MFENTPGILRAKYRLND